MVTIPINRDQDHAPQENDMVENIYFYRVTGDRQVYIYSDKGLAKVLKGTESADFLNKISALDSESAQKLMKESAAS